MLRTRILGWVLVAWFAIAAGAGSQRLLAAGEPVGLGPPDSPVGKLISGQIGRLMTLRSDLNVTADQKARIRDIVTAQKPEIAKAAKAVWEKRIALRRAVLADSPDEQAIRTASGELTRAIGDAAVLASKVAGAVKPVLTDEQREMLRKCLDECEQSTARFFDNVPSAD